MMVVASGNSLIDSLLLGEPTRNPNITYTSPANNQVFASSVDQALAKWSEVANLNFTRVQSGGELTFLYQDLGGSPGLGGVSGIRNGNQITINSALNPEVQVVTNGFTSGLESGLGGFVTILHEVGHFLGLAHPELNQIGQIGGPGFGVALPSNIANRDYTVMTLSSGSGGNFTSFTNPPQSPMPLDVQAIQYIFGANTSTNAGNTTYTFNPSNTFTVNNTTWDAGGNDTVDLSSLLNDVNIDLGEGGDRVSSVGNHNNWFAHGSNIENAFGGSGSDLITGNDIDNILAGNGGIDFLSGRKGNDNISGGDSFDSIAGGQGSDTVNGNAGDDTVNGDKGSDRVHGGKDNDTINGNAGADFVFGDLGNDIVSGGKDNDTINGNAGDDQVFGNLGNDLVNGGRGNDTVSGGDGNDSVSGDRGNDNITGGSGNDAFVFHANSGVDVITDFTVGQDVIHISSSVISSTANAVAAFSNGVLNLGGGNTVTITGISSLSESDFVIV